MSGRHRWPPRYDDKGDEYYRNDRVENFEVYVRRDSEASSDASSVHDYPNTENVRNDLRDNHPEQYEAFERNLRDRKHENHQIKHVRLLGMPHPSGSAPWQGNVVTGRVYDRHYNYMGAFHQDARTGAPIMNYRHQELAAADQQRRRDEAERMREEAERQAAYERQSAYEMQDVFASAFPMHMRHNAPEPSRPNSWASSYSASSGASWAEIARRPPPGFF